MTTVYETMRMTNGTVPFLDRHVRRLRGNARTAGLNDPPDLSQAIADARAAESPGRSDHALRVYWDGRELVVRLQEVPSRSPMKIMTASVAHEGYEVKTTEREMFDRARDEARACGADDALLLTSEGWVAEGTLFAVGWFDGSTLRMPTLDLGILPSIGRERVIELAQQLRIPIEAGRFPRGALHDRPVFAFTATRGVVRIAELDGMPVPDDERIDRLERAFWPGATRT